VIKIHNSNTEEQIAVVSDIHGNSWALVAVIEDIQKRNIRTIINLGDSLYGPLDPSGTYRLLLANNIISILGNEDRILFETNLKKGNKQTLNYVFKELSDEAMHWLRSLPSSLIIDNLYLCHGTPVSDVQYLFENISHNHFSLRSEKVLKQMISSVSQKIILCGHSHKQHFIQLKSGVIIINPGSVGLQAYSDDIPYTHSMESGTPHARFCIIKKADNKISFEYVHVTYDWETAAKKAETIGSNNWATWLRTGRATDYVP
jgi:putative phosphoesterase